MTIDKNKFAISQIHKVEVQLIMQLNGYIPKADLWPRESNMPTFEIYMANLFFMAP